MQDTAITGETIARDMLTLHAFEVSVVFLDSDTRIWGLKLGEVWEATKARDYARATIS